MGRVGQGAPYSARIVFGTLDARLLALDAGTGRPCESFGDDGEVDLTENVGRVTPGQYEITSPPVVVEDVVVVGSAIGRVDVERGTIRGFDVRTGKLLWAWDPVPRTKDDPGWEDWDEDGSRRTGAGNAWAPMSADLERGLVFAPTQPFPTHPPPLHPLELEPGDIWRITPWDLSKCREMIRSLRYDGIFTPPSLEGTLQYPSMVGANWGGAAVDQNAGLMVLNMTRTASRSRLVPRESFSEPSEAEGRRGDAAPQRGTPYGLVREGILRSPWGIPCTRPPWGTLLAVDLESGETRWEVSSGTVRDLAPFPPPLP